MNEEVVRRVVEKARAFWGCFAPEDDAEDMAPWEYDVTTTELLARHTELGAALHELERSGWQ